MHIVVLVKAVPVVGTERLDAAWRTQRTQLEANGADEYTLERALQLTEANGGEVTLLSMGPAAATDALRKGLAMGATRAVHIADDALAGACIRSTVDVLAAALRTLTYDLVFVGADTSDGSGGVVGAAVAARLGLPYLSYASDIAPAGEGRVRANRISATGYDVLEAPTPAVVMGTQLLGEPRYPSLRGIMGARTKEIRTLSLADLGLDPAAVSGTVATTRVLGAEPPPERGGATIVRGSADDAVAQVVAFLSARRLI